MRGARRRANCENTAASRLPAAAVAVISSAGRGTWWPGRRDLTGAWLRPNSGVSADRSSSTPDEEGDTDMVVIGVDSHKRTHTVVAVDGTGRKLAERTVATTGEGHLELLGWSRRWPQRTWALEDCRHLTRRLEADWLQAGEAVPR